MKIKLEKDWRAYGQLNKAGTIMIIKNNDTIKFLKENGYIYKEEKKEKKSKVKIAKENN
jgi:ATP-dependent protease HslVU (ClpYQ) peptidase subunit